MLEPVAVDWNDTCTLKHINWVEKCYCIFSTISHLRKYKLTSSSNFDLTNNAKSNMVK